MIAPSNPAVDHPSAERQDSPLPEVEPELRLLALEAILRAVGALTPLLKSADLEKIFQVGK